MNVKEQIIAVIMHNAQIQLDLTFALATVDLRGMAKLALVSPSLSLLYFSFLRQF